MLNKILDCPKQKRTAEVLNHNSYSRRSPSHRTRLPISTCDWEMDSFKYMEYTPLQLAEKRRNLALEYNQKMKELAEIKKYKAIEIIRISRDENVSATQAERLFATTEKGQKEIELNYTTKGMLELMRSVKTECDMKNAEAFGQY